MLSYNPPPYKILKNKKDVKFKIRIQKFYTEIGSAKKSLYRDWINDTFDLILDDDDYNTEDPIIQEEKEMNLKLEQTQKEINDILINYFSIHFLFFQSH